MISVFEASTGPVTIQGRELTADEQRDLKLTGRFTMLGQMYKAMWEMGDQAQIIVLGRTNVIMGVYGTVISWSQPTIKPAERNADEVAEKAV